MYILAIKLYYFIYTRFTFRSNPGATSFYRRWIGHSQITPTLHQWTDIYSMCISHAHAQKKAAWVAFKHEYSSILKKIHTFFLNFSSVSLIFIL